MNKTITILSAALLMAGAVTSCQKTVSSTRSAYDRQFEDYPTYNGDDLELSVDDSGTRFRLWSPKAEEVTLNLYNEELGGEPFQTIPMEFNKENGTWTDFVPE